VFEKQKHSLTWMREERERRQSERRREIQLERERRDQQMRNPAQDEEKRYQRNLKRQSIFHKIKYYMFGTEAVPTIEYDGYEQDEPTNASVEPYPPNHSRQVFLNFQKRLTIQLTPERSTMRRDGKRLKRPWNSWTERINVSQR
jgi:hypothetical protein